MVIGLLGGAVLVERHEIVGILGCIGVVEEVTGAVGRLAELRGRVEVSAVLIDKSVLQLLIGKEHGRLRALRQEVGSFFLAENQRIRLFQLRTAYSAERRIVIYYTSAFKADHIVPPVRGFFA